MITCIAIDDEPLALQLLSDYAFRTEGLNLLKTFTNPLDALKYLKNYAVDLLLLDIHMPDISGINFYKAVEQYSMVIFTTAYSEYAVEGFNLQAVDYLLKPIEYDRFLIAINKAIDFKKYVHLDDKSNEKCIHVRSEYSLIKIAVKDIEYIESFDDFIKIHVSEKKTVITLMSLKAIQEMLPYELFMRIHRSYLIPLNQVRSVRHNRIMLQNIELPLGISYREEFMMWFKATNE
jgi:two-component system LytT family response regulator